MWVSVSLSSELSAALWQLEPWGSWTLGMAGKWAVTETHTLSADAESCSNCESSRKRKSSSRDSLGKTAGRRLLLGPEVHRRKSGEHLVHGQERVCLVVLETLGFREHLGTWDKCGHIEIKGLERSRIAVGFPWGHWLRSGNEDPLGINLAGLSPTSFFCRGLSRRDVQCDFGKDRKGPWYWPKWWQQGDWKCPS